MFQMTIYVESSVLQMPVMGLLEINYFLLAHNEEG